MGGIASNDAELAAILAPAVTDAMQYLGEAKIEPMIEVEINASTGRGSMYSAGQDGSLSRAWNTRSAALLGMTLCEMETYYDPGEETVNSERGQHVTPRWINDGYGGQFESNQFEPTSNLAEIIDKGLGGFRLGPDNPTRSGTYFWDGILMHFKSDADSWIRESLLSAGLPLI